MVDSVVATQDSITEIIKEQEIQRKTKRIGMRTMMIKRKSTRMPTTND